MRIGWKISKYPYNAKDTNIIINKTDFSNIYSVETPYGTFSVQTFDNRFFFFENSQTAVISYPSYDFRGLEYSVINNEGDFFRFVIVPSEEVIPDIFDFIENLYEIKILETSELAKYEFLSEMRKQYS